MKKGLRDLTLAALLVMSHAAGAYAQGNNAGLGVTKEQTLSLSERIFKLEKHYEALNVYMNMNTSYQERLNGEDEGGSFVGRQLRLEFVGNIDKHWGYRLRYRMNRPSMEQSDNFGSSIDIMMAQYTFNDRFSVAAGKLGVALGGYEYDYNPIQVLEFCDFLSGINGFHIGVQGSYRFAKANTVSLGLYNPNNNSITEYYKEDPTVRKAKRPLAMAINWTGSLFGGKLETLWSYSNIHEAKEANCHFLTLGTRLNLKKWLFVVDYYGGWENLDHNKTVSADMSRARDAEVLARNTSYNTVIGEVYYKPTPHWNCFVRGSIESASAKDDPAFHNYRKSYGYQAAVQWIPDLTQDARLSLAYIGKKVDYTKDCGLEDYNRDRIELSLIYRIKVY
ncbi:MAG: hypothetical protein IJV60_00155 [Prevotella sp.]|nr:hypothetical protein [Prevotella sp.]MBQ8058805.1 hypothetical protein [Prevotella sp.]